MMCLMNCFHYTFSLNGIEDNTSTYDLVYELWASFIALGQFIGPAIGGWSSDKMGFRVSVTIMAGFALFAVSCLISMFFDCAIIYIFAFSFFI